MRYSNLKAFQKHLVSAAPRNLSCIYLLAVNNDFERAKAIRSVLSFMPTSDSQPLRLSGVDLELRALFDALQSPSLFGGESVVVLDELDQLNKKNVEAIGQFIQQPFAGYLVIGSRTKALAASVEKLGIVLDLTDEKPWDKEARISEGLMEQAKNAGKRLNPDVIPLLFERLEKESSLLESELSKLICYVGERPNIAREDVLAISASSRTHTLWQVAEEVVWEGALLPQLDETMFHGLVPILRSQLQLGLKIATLIESRTSAEEWNVHLPKVWPKTLEKRTSQAARFGSNYFRKGIQALFDMELLSRGSSTQVGALLSLFRSQLSTYREWLKNRNMPRRRPGFESGEAGAEATQPERLGDAGGSQKQWLPDAGRTNF